VAGKRLKVTGFSVSCRWVVRAAGKGVAKVKEVEEIEEIREVE
jgi:hypothetical protein